MAKVPEETVSPPDPLMVVQDPTPELGVEPASAPSVEKFSTIDVNWARAEKGQAQKTNATKPGPTSDFALRTAVTDRLFRAAGRQTDVDMVRQGHSTQEAPSRG
jgi:hypothetical protein